MASSGRVLPRSLAITLRDCDCLIVFLIVASSLASPIGTDLKPRLPAASRSLSISRPASVNRVFAVSAEIQPCMGSRGAGSSATSRSNCAPLQLFFTTSQP